MPSAPRLSHVPSLAPLSRLTARDDLLLAWLAEHYVLTTEQITNALFGSQRYAQRRLTALHDMGAVTRHRLAGKRPRTLTSNHYTLGPYGLHIHPDAYSRPDDRRVRSPRNLTERVSRILKSPRLDHLLGVNTFFTDLYAHTRRHPGEAVLSRWWSEQHATAAFAAYSGQAIRPDGHGVWTVGDRSTGFFLEYDLGNEPIGVVIAKLTAYQHLAETGPTYPVLLHLHSTRREANLLAALVEACPTVPVATAVHGSDPAGPVWATPAQPDQRLYLHELPNDHGPDSPLNPARYTDPPTEN